MGADTDFLAQLSIFCDDCTWMNSSGWIQEGMQQACRLDMQIEGILGEDEVSFFRLVVLRDDQCDSLTDLLLGCIFQAAVQFCRNRNIAKSSTPGDIRQPSWLERIQPAGMGQHQAVLALVFCS